MASTNKTELVNMSLTKLGKSRLTSFDSDTSEEAVVARLLFDELRDQVTEEGPWTFAVKRAELGLLSSTPEYEFLYEHQLPTDCLRVLEIDESIPGNLIHRVEGRKLLSDETSIEITYLSQVTDVSQWSAGFKRAFILRLAAEMSYAFRADKALTQGLYEQYQDSIQRGLATDGKQGSNQTISSSDLIEVR
jgi:hypothetical protein